MKGEILQTDILDEIDLQSSGHTVLSTPLPGFIFVGTRSLGPGEHGLRPTVFSIPMRRAAKTLYRVSRQKRRFFVRQRAFY